MTNMIKETIKNSANAVTRMLGSDKELDTQQLTSTEPDVDVIGDETDMPQKAFSEHLKQLGYREAGASNGNASVLKAVLARIQSRVIEMARKDKEGQLEFKEDLNREISARMKEIDELEGQKIDMQAHRSHIEETVIPDCEQKIRDLEEERDEVVIDAGKYRDSVKSNPIQKILIWCFFLLGTIYLYLFYVTASYSAIIREPDLSMEGLNSGNTITELFQTVFSAEAYQTFNFHWLVPIAFFMIGMMLHRALDIRGWQRWFWVLLSGVLIIAVDGILAFQIESKVAEQKYILGVTDDPAYTLLDHAIYDEMFYMILILGSLSVISWSVVVHELKELYSNYPGSREMKARLSSIRRKVKKERQEILGLRKKMSELAADAETMDVQIAGLKRENTRDENRIAQVSYSPAQLSGYLASFYQGWMQFVSRLDDKALELTTIQAFQESVSAMEVEVPGFMNILQMDQDKRYDPA